MDSFWEDESWWRERASSEVLSTPEITSEQRQEEKRRIIEAAHQEDIQDIRNLLEDALHDLSRGQVATARQDIQAALDRLPSL